MEKKLKSTKRIMSSTFRAYNMMIDDIKSISVLCPESHCCIVVIYWREVKLGTLWFPKFTAPRRGGGLIRSHAIFLDFID